jgi:hypothetical protein
MKKFKASAVLDSGKYRVTFPVVVEASGFAAAGQRVIRAALKQWRVNGHRRLPISMSLIELKIAAEYRLTEQNNDQESLPRPGLG